VTTVVFHPLAERELLQSAKFYESRRRGLGRDFIRRVEEALEQVAVNPDVGRPFVGEIRRWLVRRFPFGILYKIEKETVLVLAVMHLRRRPGYWRSRLHNKS